jgi:murein DD-endopeptidase MepM/ murein hydrolase activator NlpD
MPYLLSDIVIGDFPETQVFGADYQTYHARYNLQGHNGIDLGCPTNTPVIAAAPGNVYKVGLEELGTFDTTGFGRYVKLVHGDSATGFYKTIYAHLNDVAVKVGDRVVKGQLIGHSNNTGFSSGPHLHFGIAPCNAQGIDLQPNNGFSGYINPTDTTLVKWEITNPSAPASPYNPDLDQPMAVKRGDFTRMVTEGSSYKVIVSFLSNHGLNDYLVSRGKPAIDLDHPDPENGNRCVEFLAELLSEMREMDHRLKEQAPAQAPLDPEQVLSQMPLDQRNNLLKNILSSLKGFIFVQSQK